MKIVDSFGERHVLSKESMLKDNGQSQIKREHRRWSEYKILDLVWYSCDSLLFSLFTFLFLFYFCTNQFDLTL